jgi:outer membrane protein TolC
MVCVLGVLLLAGNVLAQGSGQIIRMDLQQCIDRALMVSPDVEQAELAVRQLEARLSEAKFAGILPQFQWTNIFGPSPGVTGNPDSLESIRSDLSNVGIFSRTTVDVVQPLYTFGKIGGAREAARHGVEAGEAGVVRKKRDIALQVKKLYYGLMLARALREVVEEAQENVRKARNRVNQLLEEDSDDVGVADLLKIDVFEYEVKKNLARADKSIELGRAALMMTLNLDRAADFDIVAPSEEPEPVQLDTLDAYVSRARTFRPDIRQLHAGLQARRSLLKVTRSDFYPQIAFVGSLQWGIAPNRPHFDNPFLRDDFNFFRAGGLITLRQQFSFGLTNAKYQAQKAELEELTSKENQAMKALALEVEQAYREVLEADGNVRNSDRAMRSAKSWLTSAAIGFDITGDSSDLLNAFTAYSRMRQEYHQSVFNLYVAQAVLDHVTGADMPEDRM